MDVGWWCRVRAFGGMGGDVVAGAVGSSDGVSDHACVIGELFVCLIDWLSYCCCSEGSLDGIVLLTGGGGLVTVVSMM